MYPGFMKWLICAFTILTYVFANIGELILHFYWYSRISSSMLLPTTKPLNSPDLLVIDSEIATSSST